MANIRLRLDLSGVALQFSGSEAFYDRWVEPIVAATCARATTLASSGGEAPKIVVSRTEEAPAAEAQAEPDSAVFKPENPTRFQQFVSQVGNRASTTEQLVMAFGFYLWNYEKRNAFARADVEAFFGLLHQEIPEDLDALVTNLVERKRFLEAEGEAQWKLTTKGVNYVKNRLLGSV